MPAKIIKINSTDYKPELLEEPARIIADGGIVAFPTETVYGLAVNVDNPDAVRRLRQLKNSPADRPFTYHLADVDDIYRMTSSIGRLAKRIIRNYMPGPVTIVLPDGKDNWMGFRVPDNKVARDLIRLSGVKVIATSANTASETAPSSVDKISGVIRNAIDYIVDGGTAKLGVSSSVIKIGSDNKCEILREGSIKADDIRKLDYKLILFVCTGNTCRSPMAAGLFRKMLAQKIGSPVTQLEARGYKVGSAGTSAVYNSPASGLAVKVMNEMGVDIKSHLSQPVTLTLVEEADKVYVMTKGHLETLREWMPAADNISLLDISGEDIADPIGQDISVYRSCAFRIKQAIERLQL
ncbi:MAG: L-threonylcarbamoyladenylate synthase [Candidatus Brocadiia bacterium]